MYVYTGGLMRDPVGCGHAAVTLRSRCRRIDSNRSGNIEVSLADEMFGHGKLENEYKN